MALELIYKNDFGTVVMQGIGNGAVRICKAEGLGVVQKEYRTAIYTGQAGQATLSARALPRCITLSLEVIGRDIFEVLKDTLRILSCEGMLFIRDSHTDKRIYCNQVQIPDMERVLKNKITAFAVQFVCDNPYFEDGEDTSVPLYKRTKKLETPFTMPCVFGEIIAEAQIDIAGSLGVEPRIVMYYPKALKTVENINIINMTTGKSICLNYAPKEDDTVVIDVKTRSITSTKSGNLLNYLSIDTFLGDFVLERGRNLVTVDLGDMTPDFTVECRYNNLYAEAVLV